MAMEPLHFKLLLVLLVVAYKAWEFLRNAARKKSEEARSMPVPQDLDQLPWEDRSESAPTREEHTPPQVLRPEELFSPRHQETVQLVTIPPPAASNPTPMRFFAEPVAWAPRAAQPHPRLREWVIGQVVLGKPVSMSPRKFPPSALKP